MLYPSTFILLYHYLVSHPVMLLATAGFGYLHHRTAERLNCFGFLPNLVYGLASAAVNVILLYAVAFFLRFAGVGRRPLTEILAGFAAAALIIVLYRMVFAQAPSCATGATDNNLGQ